MERIPFVGETVHYVARGSADGVFRPVCRAAIVTAIGDEYHEGVEIVHLCVLNPEGMYFNHHVNHDEEEKIGGTWHWLD